MQSEYKGNKRFNGLKTQFVEPGLFNLLSYLDSIFGRVNYCEITYLERGYVVRTKSSN
jgi:hypothetical protein